MSDVASSRLPLPLRFAIRELRAGLRGFYVLVLCIALGVMAIAGIGSVADSLAGGLAREGRTILGGDVSFALIHRETKDDERAFLDQSGKVSAAATMRAMARTADERNALVEIKAVDKTYPLFGTVVLEPNIPLDQAIAERGGVFGAAVDVALLTRLDLKVGDRITVGSAPIEIRAVLRSEPDKLAGGIGFGPRLLISIEAVRATGLIQPGSLVRWLYRVQIPQNDATDRAAKALVEEAEKKFPEAGWEIRSRDNASPQLERNIERFTQFLTLVGLTALLVGGVGVANAVRSHLDRRRDTIATMKSLGATGGRVFAIYLVQVMAIAAIGTAIGLAIGAALPFAINWAFGAIIPLPIEPAIQPAELALAGLFGLLTALAFAVWPLGRAHDIPVSALFRDAVAGVRRWPRKPYIAAATFVTLLLAGLAIALSYDKRIATIFVASAAATFVMLRVVAAFIMWGAAKLPRARMTALRLAIANIHGPGALTPSVVLSLGLGLAVLVIVVADRRQPAPAIPAIPAGQVAGILLRRHPEQRRRAIRYLHPQGGAGRDRRPRADAARAHRVGEWRPRRGYEAVAASGLGVAKRPRRDLCRRPFRRARRSWLGEWWPKDYSGPPLLSMEKRIADGLGLKVGDTLTVNVLGRNISARIANLRSVDWQTPRHQFRAGLFAEHLPRRAAYPYRDADFPSRHDRAAGRR